MNRINFLLLLLFLHPPSSLAAQQSSIGNLPIPSGWRLPCRSEVNQSWRNASPQRFVVATGDFDGNGSLDTAMVLIRSDRSAYAAFVILRKYDGHDKIVQLEPTMKMEFLATEGLKVVSPGKFLTACGKGYGCAPGAQKSIDLTHDGIEVFKDEGPARILYLRGGEAKFSEAWISD